ncbi:hypothetical protein [Jeotgalibacillus terrae]|uniref:Uncharacterized protein n=1 Tax=Jeotgalibacillus terrae TaxID=587735 RepID=A0ABW5ZLV8_9BACL|nr:hypothetical protein [Jeotgalibacillus terrae]MBM7577358.1 hypothetical protein [Jeotgalibacillus terrae]
MTDPHLVLRLYASLWKNRPINSIEMMNTSIMSDLYDENTHPRLRRTPEEKYMITRQLICDSELTPEQQRLLNDYIKVIYEQTFNK